ncbi:hypothetical protein D6D10_08291 [Aureobasidium pullulans]|uniref:Uncharacterized protein n=1 Tax=Aureobasidium pullulans TaxID=5580 RepID=A0A4S9ED81_AURPU|nr:hypothetical protein D6D10_08291 [Aureobasidium pullulans]
MGEVSVYFLLLIYHRANLRAVTTECENQSTDVRRNILQGAEAVIESPEITQGLLLLHSFRVLLNHVDAVTFGGADDTG